jgi:parallel beta-helix repeat protein
VAYVRNLHVANNRCVNDIATKTPIDNMMVDASQGCENGLIENNYAYGFFFGAKCETRTGVGPSGTEIRPSRNIYFLNNRFDQIGDPTQFTIPGPSGGDTYGLKINGINCKAIGNQIMPRTIGVTAGGLAQGIACVGTHADDSHNIIEDNYIKGVQYGINHNDSTPTTRKSTHEIRKNRIDDALIYGVLVQSNVSVEDNRIYRSARSAIAVQSPNDTIIRNNRAFNCASSDNPIIPERVVFYQEGAGSYSGLQEWTDNVILDDRGASAAEYGYFIRGGATYSNALIFRPGYTTGLLTSITYDTYVSTLGFGMQRNATTNPARREFQATNSPAIQAPWDGMAWNVGDRAVLMPPVVGSPKAWVCTVAGTPGTWVSEGNL